MSISVPHDAGSCSRAVAGILTGSWVATGPARLYRRAGCRAVGAEHAAITRSWAQDRAAGGALVDPQAGVGRHLKLVRRAALRAGEGGNRCHLRCWRRHCVTLVKITNPASSGKSTASRWSRPVRLGRPGTPGNRGRIGVTQHDAGDQDPVSPIQTRPSVIRPSWPGAIWNRCARMSALRAMEAELASMVAGCASSGQMRRKGWVMRGTSPRKRSGASVAARQMQSAPMSATGMC